MENFNHCSMASVGYLGGLSLSFKGFFVNSYTSTEQILITVILAMGHIFFILFSPLCSRNHVFQHDPTILRWRTTECFTKRFTRMFMEMLGSRPFLLEWIDWQQQKGYEKVRFRFSNSSCNIIQVLTFICMLNMSQAFVLSLKNS